MHIEVDGKHYETKSENHLHTVWMSDVINLYASCALEYKRGFDGGGCVVVEGGGAGYVVVEGCVVVEGGGASCMVVEGGDVGWVCDVGKQMRVY